eukprot:scaffold231763_cov21-Cyclotella_meneghiniana.AAC.1
MASRPPPRLTSLLVPFTFGRPSARCLGISRPVGIKSVVGHFVDFLSGVQGCGQWTNNDCVSS